MNAEPQNLLGRGSRKHTFVRAHKNAVWLAGTSGEACFLLALCHLTACA